MTNLQTILGGSRALVFVNPVAGAGRAGRHLLGVRRAFEAEQVPAEFVLTADRDRSGVASAYGDRDGCRFLLAMGGDGTLQGLVNAAYGSGVLLGRAACRLEGTTSPLHLDCLKIQWPPHTQH